MPRSCSWAIQSMVAEARRVGGATYQVPIEVRPERRQTLGLRWLTTYARNRGEKTMVVLPASMWAMMPMFRVFSRDTFLGILSVLLRYQR